MISVRHFIEYKSYTPAPWRLGCVPVACVAASVKPITMRCVTRTSLSRIPVFRQSHQGVVRRDISRCAKGATIVPYTAPFGGGGYFIVAPRGQRTLSRGQRTPAAWWRSLWSFQGGHIESDLHIVCRHVPHAPLMAGFIVCVSKPMSDKA